MQCKTATRLIFEESLGEEGAIDAAGLSALESHCADCSGCRTRRAAESTLTSNLRSVSCLQGPDVQVDDRVLARIRKEPAPVVRTATAKGFGWAMAGAGMATAGFIALTVAIVPYALPVLGSVFRGIGILLKSATPLLAVTGAVLRVLELGVRSISSLAPILESLAPVAFFAVCTGALLALISSLVIVGRDLSRSPQPALRKER